MIQTIGSLTSFILERIRRLKRSRISHTCLMSLMFFIVATLAVLTYLSWRVSYGLLKDNMEYRHMHKDFRLLRYNLDLCQRNNQLLADIIDDKLDPVRPIEIPSKFRLEEKASEPIETHSDTESDIEPDTIGHTKIEDSPTEKPNSLGSAHERRKERTSNIRQRSINSRANH